MSDYQRLLLTVPDLFRDECRKVLEQEEFYTASVDRQSGILQGLKLSFSLIEKSLNKSQLLTFSALIGYCGIEVDKNSPS